MLSAIFGNILGYTAKSEETEDSSKFTEASTQTSDNKSTSTQVNLDESKASHNESAHNRSCQDWVIVDEIAENDKACGSEDVDMNQEKQTKPESEASNEDPLIGSFFQRNEAAQDDEEMRPAEPADKTVTQTVLTVAKRETWLITPLPCLTSITEGSQQQKSMIDSDPLENLLIEQPTRFMSTSTTEQATPPKRRSQARKQRTKAEATEVMQSDDCFIEDLFKEQPSTPVMQRSVAEKRKEAEKSSSVSPTPSNEYPKKISRKAAKSLKNKSSSHQHQKNLNKENMQVKSLLMAECFGKDGLKNGNNNTRYGQMTRANKNAALFGLAGNARTRKFHNLQQPSMTTVAKNQKL